VHKRGIIWTVEPEWLGETVFIIGGGPSVATQNVERLRGRRVIVINSSLHAFPWADIVVFCDNRWWREPENRKAVEEFQGIAVTTSVNVVSPKVRTMIKGSTPGLAKNRNSIVMRRTSLTAAINLAVHLGAATIVLLGADGKATDGQAWHHKPHRWPARKGCWDEQKRDLATLVEPLKQRGVTTVNCSPGSAWADLWPVMSLNEFIAQEAPLAA
jgi:hypothetical protein